MKIYKILFIWNPIIYFRLFTFVNQKKRRKTSRTPFIRPSIGPPFKIIIPMTYLSSDFALYTFYLTQSKVNITDIELEYVEIYLSDIQKNIQALIKYSVCT